MILDTSLIKLEAVLAGAVAANQPEVHVDYIVHTDDGGESRPSTYRTALNSTTDVSILAPPGTQGNTRSSSVLEPIFVSIYNKDTATVTVTVKTDDGTERIIGKWLLATQEVLMYEKGAGWYVMAANGAIKNGAGVSGPASSTDNAVVRWDGTTGTVTQNSGVIIDDSNNITGVVALTMNGLLDTSGASGGQIKFPATQNASADANTLDDYEEGTFTPAGSFGGGTTGITYTNQQGAYTKIGNVVSVRLRVTLSNNGSSTGAFNVTGLPFSAAGSPSSSFATYGSGLTGTSGGLAMTTTGTSLNGWFLGTGSATQLSDTTVTDTGDFIVSGTYNV